MAQCQTVMDSDISDTLDDSALACDMVQDAFISAEELEVTVEW